MIVIVVAIGCSMPVLKAWMERNQSNHAESDTIDTLEREIASLRERVEVLEEIATDQKHQLRREIAALGD